METTFYDDSMSRLGKNDNQALKRPVTLNLESPGSAAKRTRFDPILTSPDLKMLQLASPELERLIISNSNFSASTPTPTSFFFPKNVTEEQEQYARGFIDALNQLRQPSLEINNNFLHNFRTGLTPVSSNAPDIVITSTTAPVSTSAGKLYNSVLPFTIQSAPISSPTSVIKSLGNAKSIVNAVRPPSVDNFSSNSCSSSSMPVPLEINIKEELQTVPSDYSSPPMSPLYKAPIDMEDQERIKLERKRQRNRVAASKCRKRKLERISQLELKVKELKGENSKLEMVAKKLRGEVCNVKQIMMEHVTHGCSIQVPKSYLS
ncbi:transcription factor Jun [Parasteatoda tepidariorum]|uniref:Transcription factor AP-1 n=1 Tax=Parasteatoda tepidariorum TaxID=114398 RepID=A0A2L2Y8Y3_PARTP|nr:transcription factor AP-1 [Parasteatoda tepidariorum]